MLHTTCQCAIAACMEKKTYAVSLLAQDEKASDMHIHDCYEIFVTLSGGNHFIIGQRIYETPRGSLFAINPYEAHKPIITSNAAYERYAISLHPQYVEQLSSHETDLSRCFMERGEGFDHRILMDTATLHHLIALIEGITHSHGFGIDLLARAAFTQLLIMVNELYQSRAPHAPLPLPKHALVERLLAYIHQHIREPLSLEVLSQELFVSVGTLCRLFRQETGTTINKYILSRRISLAKQFLMEGRQVQEVATLCGFGDYSHFIRSFGRLVGTSPKQYALSRASSPF